MADTKKPCRKFLSRLNYNNRATEHNIAHGTTNQAHIEQSNMSIFNAASARNVLNHRLESSKRMHVERYRSKGRTMNGKEINCMRWYC
jgi:hypothetical protein